MTLTGIKSDHLFQFMRKYSVPSVVSCITYNVIEFIVNLGRDIRNNSWILLVGA